MHRKQPVLSAQHSLRTLATSASSLNQNKIHEAYLLPTGRYDMQYLAMTDGMRNDQEHARYAELQS